MAVYPRKRGNCRPKRAVEGVEEDEDGLLTRLDQPELDGFFIVLLVAGNETTTNLISNQLHILSERPDLWQRRVICSFGMICRF
jgi:cytochrome P450